MDRDEQTYHDAKSFGNNNTSSGIQLDKENKRKKKDEKVSSKEETGNEKQMRKEHRPKKEDIVGRKNKNK